jgi:uncharacterized protein
VDLTSRSARRVDLDVVRGVALVGVCVMNYHGYLVLRGAPLGDGFVHRLFNPFDGPLSTRFAATFVVVAGIGTSLLVDRVRRFGSDIERIHARLVVAMRGAVLFALGFALEHIWNGTIMWFYGLYFVIGAVVVFVRREVLVGLAVAVMAASVAVQWARVQHGFWPPRGDVFSLVGGLQWSLIDGTHPLLPWLVFYLAGMLLGRAWPADPRRLATVGAVLVAAALTAHWLVPSGPVADVFVSLSPWSRSPVYVAETLGVALLALAIIGTLAERHRAAPVVVALAATGRTTLTLYVGHVLVFELLVDRLEVVRPTGLDTALLFALGYWLVGIAVAVLVQARFGIGPCEWLYRRVSGRVPQPARVAEIA